MRLLAVVMLVAWIAAPGVAAAADPVNAAVTLDRGTITVGDPIYLSIVADADPGYQVADPTLARQVGDFEVLDTLATQQTRRIGGSTRYTFRYRITAFVLGDLVLPPIEVPYVDPTGVKGVARTPQQIAHVVTVVQSGEDTSDIKALKPQLDLPEALAARLLRLGLGLVGAAAVSAAAALAFWLVLRQRERLIGEARLTPVQRALRDLEELQELRLPELGRTAEHYERLASSVRRYVVEQFRIEPGRTTRELRAAMERAGVDSLQASAICEILQEGDEVRYRHHIPFPAHAHNAVRAALEIVRRAATAEEYEIAALRPQ